MTPLKMRRLVELETALRAAGLWGDDSFGPDGKTPAVPPDQRRGVSLSMVNGVPTIRRYPLTTDAEYADAVVLLAAHDWTGATDAAEQLRGQATAAVADLDTFIALANPTNAQRDAQVRRQAQILKVVIRRLLQITRV